MNQQKVALITGASTGIGKELALVLAQKGYSLGLMARRKEILEEVQREISGLYPDVQVEIQPSDVSVLETIQKDIQLLVSKLGRLDLFIANAGIGLSTPGWKNMTSITLKILQTNTLGAIASLEAAKAIMLEQKSGHLVGISSVAATRGLPASTAYCASKSALSCYLESLRVDLKPKGYAVTTVQPGFIATPMTERNDKMPFLLPADKAAKMIYEAIEKRKARYTFPWQMKIITTLLKHFPDRLYDFILTFKFKGGVFK